MSIDTSPVPARTVAAPAPCPVCGSSDPEPALGGLVQCPACTHTYRPALLAPTNEVFESDDYVAWRAASVEHRRIAADRVRAMAAMAATTGRFLEIGCSTGEVVAEMADLGWEAYGIDLSAAAVEAGAAAHPAAALGVGMTPAEAGFGGTYDLVAAFHVVEHVPDLGALRASLRSWLRPGGLLHLRVPNWASWSRRVSGDRWPALMPEHVHQFTPESMRRWLDEGGFEPIDISAEGRAREWLGAARRLVSDPAVGEAEVSRAAASPRRLKVVRRVERWGRPWFALEQRWGAGSELAVYAWVR